MDILDLDELKWYDDNTFGSACAATSDDGKLPRHFGLAGQSLESLSPEIIRRAELAKVINVRERGAWRWTKMTHNFVARFGASRSSGGTRPF
jgi:hypothetical protein